MKRLSIHPRATFPVRFDPGSFCHTSFRRPVRVATAFVVALVGTFCFAQEKKLESMRGVNRGQDQPALPTLLISINDSVGSIAEPGWPLVVSATRMADDKSAAVPLPSNLRLKLTNERGMEVPIAFTPVARLPASETPKGLTWLVAEDATSRLGPGIFRVTNAAAPGESTGWRVESGEFQLVTSNPERSPLLGHLKIQRAVAGGKIDDALAEADRLIAANARNKEAWIAKGDLLMKKDQPDEAVQAYDSALSLHAKTEREPLAIMTRRRSAVFRSLEKRGIVTPKPAAP